MQLHALQMQRMLEEQGMRCNYVLNFLGEVKNAYITKELQKVNGSKSFLKQCCEYVIVKICIVGKFVK